MEFQDESAFLPWPLKDELQIRRSIINPERTCISYVRRTDEGDGLLLAFSFCGGLCESHLFDEFKTCADCGKTELECLQEAYYNGNPKKCVRCDNPAVTWRQNPDNGYDDFCADHAPKRVHFRWVVPQE